MQVIPYTGTGLTAADRDRVTTIRLRTNVSTPPPQTASYFRSGVENNFVVLFHFTIHFFPTIWPILRSSCSRHNVFKWRSWGSWFEDLLGNDYLESGLGSSGIYRHVVCICRCVVCIYCRVGLHLPSYFLYLPSCCLYLPSRRFVSTIVLCLQSCCLYVPTLVLFVSTVV